MVKTIKFTKEDFYNGMSFKIKGHNDIYRYHQGKLEQGAWCNEESHVYRNFYYCELGRIQKLFFEAYTTFLNRPIMTVVLFKHCEYVKN